MEALRSDGIYIVAVEFIGNRSSKWVSQRSELYIPGCISVLCLQVIP